MFVVFVILFIVSGLTLLTVHFMGVWASYTKAGRPGWAALIPIYTWVVALDIAGKPGYWILLMMFVPFGALIWGIMASIALAENYGKSAGFGIGLLLAPFVFYPLLGFGDAEYRG